MIGDGSSKSISYGGVIYEHTDLSGAGFTMTPVPSVVGDEVLRSAVVQSAGRVWDLREFQIERAPLVIGRVANAEAFMMRAPRVLDMPVKFPRSREFRIPAEFLHLRQVLQMIIDFEFTVNPDAQSGFAYLTVDQMEITSGGTHRRPGPHVDGIQGRNYPCKFTMCRSYLVTNTDPTVFYRQTFAMNGVDINRHNLNRIFAEQVDPRRAARALPLEITLMDAFTVHESPPMVQSGRRTLLRLEFSRKIYDRMGNTHNPLFDYDWKMIPLPIHDDLE